MSDLFDDPEPGDNAPEFTVTEISGAVKKTIEGTFGHVRVKGEVGRVSRPRSGHIYLDLKDDRNVLSGIIWKGVSARLRTQPEEGMEVVATGKLTTFGGQSKYQMVIDDIAPAGMGALMAMLEKRKAQLAEEGLFAPERKQPLPFLPEIIGVITSPSGAVIRDILHRLRDRFPRKVLIWPVAVQGAKCAPEVAAAIEGFNRLTPGGAMPRPDLLIVARGGGSIEDLWGFNEEVVARAAAASQIPLISAVGHETDTTLIDFVADRRAPTPTAAAELAVPVRLELMAALDTLNARQLRGLEQGVRQRRQRLSDLSRALPRPDALLATPSQRLDTASARLPLALRAAASVKQQQLSKASGPLAPGLLRRRIAEETRRLQERGAGLSRGLTRSTQESQRALSRASDRLRPEAITRDLDRKKRDLDALTARFVRAANAQVNGWQSRLEAAERLRQTLGYTETLKRGYAVVRGDEGVITTKAEAETARSLEVEFADGRLRLGGKTPGKTAKSAPEQGSLF
ncbi:exodeoxyribonuclease VII large subunit [Pseudoruegeria sp. SHC-113]|uniref:exodeoxyribonuclease VII large subunit n=1 Tax=Pseudoruegeria sp. SHC-113 TaxID=2855439 RepID=UPI0021BB018A|nr:exodeoxyribonuclease VII large subunit [Pseudoruegeria sp. SHC-113]MCT8159838.1 exodeoxyribonuclease VII large subunit [Pseudoruegeria sp. SHC-113]